MWIDAWVDEWMDGFIKHDACLEAARKSLYTFPRTPSAYGNFKNSIFNYYLV